MSTALFALKLDQRWWGKSMGIKWRRWTIGPSILAALAVAIGVSPWLRPNRLLDFGPLDLSRGATRTVTFRAGYSELHAIGLQMDQLTAKRLSPCMADMEWYSEHKAKCEQGGALAWPVELSFFMSRHGEDISRNIEISKAQAGGQYGGNETYTWQPALIELQRGVEYTLTVRTLSDASRLSAAHPRMVVEVVSPGFLEGLALKNFAAFITALGLSTAAVIWLVVGWTNARRKRQVAT